MNAKLFSGDGVVSDADLVARSAAGDREAFGDLVRRYQSLVCSIAYNATGNLAQSEDVAQETFVAAWKHLPKLREPAKVRAWLCGIARNLGQNGQRRLTREPAHAAQDLDVLAGAASAEPWPSDQAVTHEQETILWRALERIPETYREPLILFYREHQSIESVARDLDLSEDAVKQRLSRGRRLLHEQVLAFVEGTLERTAPGPTFTSSVLGALPLFAASGVASAAGSGAAKGAAAFSWSSILVAVQVAIGPIMGILGAWAGYRASMRMARTPPERALVKRNVAVILTMVVGFMVVVTLGVTVIPRVWRVDAVTMGISAVVVALLYIGGILAVAVRFGRQFRRLRGESRRAHPESFVGVEDPAACGLGWKYSYRSRWTFLGLPLVHVRFGTTDSSKRSPAVGWIAMGDYAIGILFAVGGVSVGTISIGGASLGLLAIGGASLGAAAIGGVSLGGFALGGVALGYVATGGAALAWSAAQGGIAVARDFALGVQASATHINDAAANEFYAQHPWFDVRHPPGTFVLHVCWLPLLLVFLQWRQLRDVFRPSPPAR